MKHRKVIFIVAGFEGIGLGHCYRILELYNAMSSSERKILLMPGSVQAFDFFHNEGLDDVALMADLATLYHTVNQQQPDLIINDVLDTSVDFVENLKQSLAKVINFEDIGEGHLSSDLTINAIYSGINSHNCLYGYQYIDIRNEFFVAEKAQLNATTQNILISFGGEDPSNLTLRVLKLIAKHPKLKGYKYIIVLGNAYHWKTELTAYVQQSGLNHELLIQTNLAEQMRRADMAVVSNGRTPFELAAMGVPSVVISAHARECLHTFYRRAGFAYCGNAQLVSNDDIALNISMLSENYANRMAIRKKLEQLDFSFGQDRILALINQILHSKGDRQYGSQICQQQVA